MTLQTHKNPAFKGIPLYDLKLPVKTAKKWKTAQAFFVKMNPRNKADMAVLKDVEKLWHGQNMSGAIVEQSKICKDPVYVITTQDRDFKKMAPINILGMLTTHKIDAETKIAQIFRLGTDPFCAYAQNGRKRDIKHTGSSILKQFVRMLKEKTNVEKIKIEAKDSSSAKFYKKIKLHKSTESPNVFELTRNEFDNFIK